MLEYDKEYSEIFLSEDGSSEYYITLIKKKHIFKKTQNDNPNNEDEIKLSEAFVVAEEENPVNEDVAVPDVEKEKECFVIRMFKAITKKVIPLFKFLYHFWLAFCNSAEYFAIFAYLMVFVLIENAGNFPIAEFFCAFFSMAYMFIDLLIENRNCSEANESILFLFALCLTIFLTLSLSSTPVLMLQSLSIRTIEAMSLLIPVGIKFARKFKTELQKQKL